LAGLTKAQQKALLDGLRSEDAALMPHQVVGKIADRVFGDEKAKYREVVPAVFQFCFNLNSTKQTFEEFVEDVVQSEDLALPDTKKKSFRDFLMQVATIKHLQITTKAVWVQMEHLNVFDSARVLTDVRPVFDRDPDAEPDYMVVIHNLKISYSENGEMKEFFVALDSTDLGKIRDVIERAAKKEKSVKSRLIPTGVKFLDPVE
jgi:hypothetical protein